MGARGDEEATSCALSRRDEARSLQNANGLPERPAGHPHFARDLALASNLMAHGPSFRQYPVFQTPCDLGRQFHLGHLGYSPAMALQPVGRLRSQVNIRDSHLPTKSDVGHQPGTPECIGRLIEPRAPGHSRPLPQSRCFFAASRSQPRCRRRSPPRPAPLRRTPRSFILRPVARHVRLTTGGGKSQALALAAASRGRLACLEGLWPRTSRRRRYRAPHWLGTEARLRPLIPIALCPRRRPRRPLLLAAPAAPAIGLARRETRPNDGPSRVDACQDEGAQIELALRP